MKTRFYIKLGTIVFLILALLIPESYLLGLVSERTAWRQKAYQSIEQSWPGTQTLAGPILSIPYDISYNTSEKIVDANKVEKEIFKEVTIHQVLYIIPKKLTINSKLTTTERYRGIYAVPIYSNEIQLNGEFSNQAMLDVIADNKDKLIRWQKPQLSVLVCDQRGITIPPDLNWNNAKFQFLPGSKLPGTISGMHSKLPEITLEKETRLLFAMTLELRGMRSMNFALLSEDTRIQLSANWLHPSFNGELLPETRDINKAGFIAIWRASSFSYDVSNALAQCYKGDCSALFQRSVGFDLISPVDIYQQSERSVKYAALFIILTFMTLILFELLKKQRIHPIQYALAGMALLVFYLLLISLSEHLLFLYAYIIGALASTSLLTCYFGAILGSYRLGLILGAGLFLLYSLLYVILQSEENALLMGSLLIFSVLSALMLTTRNLDWYALTGQAEEIEGLSGSCTKPANS
jgi:inner membrane protein